jgi:hypothetical protein
MAVISINWTPSNRELRSFAVLLLLFFVVVGGIWFWKTNWITGPISLVSVASVIALLGLAVPRAIRWVYVGWMIAVWPLGWTISHLLLAAIYFGVIMPIGWLLRLTGRDPMKKSWDQSATTYWVQRPSEPTDTRRYFRQF